MEEEPQVQPAPEETPAETPAEPERRPLEEVMADWDYYVRNNPEYRATLAKHDVVAGIAGGLAGSIAQRQQAEQQQVAAKKAAEDALAAQIKLADEDPEAFAAQFKEETRARMAESEIRNIALNERTKLSDALGRAFDDLPDGKMSQAEVHELAQALVGVPEERVFAAYTAKRTDILANRRAEARAEARINERLAAEKEAWEAEQAATRAKRSPAPTVRSGNPPGTDSGEPDFRRDPQAWNAWYEENQNGRRMTRA